MSQERKFASVRFAAVNIEDRTAATGHEQTFSRATHKVLLYMVGIMKTIIACLVISVGVLGSTCNAAETLNDDTSTITSRDKEKLPDSDNPANVRIIIHAVTAKSIYGAPFKFELTDAVYLIETRGSRSLIRSMETLDEEAGDPVWVPNADLADISAFKPLESWQDAARCQFTSGDAILTYEINAGGSFRLSDPQWWAHGRPLKQEDLRSEIHIGQLYQAGEVVWARALDTEPNDFWFARNKFTLKNGRLYSVWFDKFCSK